MILKIIICIHINLLKKLININYWFYYLMLKREKCVYKVKIFHHLEDFLGKTNYGRQLDELF